MVRTSPPTSTSYSNDFESICKIDEVLIETNRDVVVFLNLACVPQTNLVDKPPQVGNATEERFGAPGILHHLRFLRTIILLDLQALPRETQ